MRAAIFRSARRRAVWHACCTAPRSLTGRGPRRMAMLAHGVSPALACGAATRRADGGPVPVLRRMEHAAPFTESRAPRARERRRTRGPSAADRAPGRRRRQHRRARLATGFGEFDRVLGGGLVPGGVVLIGGDPGIGKSTLLLQCARAPRAGALPALYATGEESVEQVGLRARRLGVGERRSTARRDRRRAHPRARRDARQARRRS